MNKQSLVGALDIGGTKIAASIANANGPLARVTEPTPKSGTPSAQPQRTVKSSSASCASLCDSRMIALISASAAGMSPGPKVLTRICPMRTRPLSRLCAVV